MAWRANTKLELPDDLAELDELEIDADDEEENGTGYHLNHADFVKEVVKDAFHNELLEPGLYYVRVAGHKGDNADNLSISINRTA